MPRSSVLAAIRQITGTDAEIQLREPDQKPAGGTATAPEVREGQSGRYEIVGEIARGGIGVILKARDTDLGRDVALKVLSDDYLHKPEMAHRFVEEAQIGGQLQHPGIVPVYELGLQTDARPYFAMKLLQGQTLADLLEARKDASQERHKFLGIFQQICQTVAYAHARGVIHRDLKPANVMVGSFGEVQVLDWGMAKVMTGRHGKDVPSESVESRVDTKRSKEGKASLSGSVMGTPAYMAPEQARGEVDQVDERSDVFGLGAILCEILTGKPPYLGNREDDARKQATQGDLGGAHNRLDASGADTELLRIAKWCLEPEQRARPRNAEVLAMSLGQYLASVEERARGAELEAAEARVRVVGERRARHLTLALAASIILGGGVYLWMERAREARAAETRRTADQVLTEATLLWETAREADADSLQAWNAAQAAAQRLQAVIASGEADADTRERVSRLVTELETEAGQARKDLALLDELQAIRLGPRSANRERDARYAEAFRNYGIDLDALTTEEAAQEIRGGKIGPQLAEHLDVWAQARLEARNAKSRQWTELMDVALRVDEDPSRRMVRNAVRGRNRDGLVEMAESLSLDAIPPATALLMGEALANAREYESAVTFLKRAWAKYRDDFWINRTLAWSLEQSDGWSEAALYHATALGAHSHTGSRTLVDLGIARRRAGDTEGAEEVLESIPDEDRVDAYLYMGSRLTDELQDFQGGIEAFGKVLELDEESAQAYYNLGVALLGQGNPEEALVNLRMAANLDPHITGVHNNIGVVLARQGEIEEAEAAYREGLEYNDSDYLLHFNLGALLKRKKGANLLEAERELRESILLNPFFSHAHDNLGGVLLAMKDVDAAIEIYREATRIDNRANSHYSLAWAYELKGDLESAVDAASNAVRLQPGNQELSEFRHYLLRRSGRFEDVLAIMGEAYGAESAEARLIELRERLDEILESGQAPEDAEECALLAELCAREERYAAAAELYRSALDRQPGLDVMDDAARAAAEAGMGRGRDAAQLDESARAAWRQKALEWSQVIAAGLREGMARGEDASIGIYLLALHPAPLRDPDALARLPEDEQRAWSTYWQEVDDLFDSMFR